MLPWKQPSSRFTPRFTQQPEPEETKAWRQEETGGDRTRQDKKGHKEYYSRSVLCGQHRQSRTTSLSPDETEETEDRRDRRQKTEETVETEDRGDRGDRRQRRQRTEDIFSSGRWQERTKNGLMSQTGPGPGPGPDLGLKMDSHSCSVLVDFLRYVEDLGLRTYDDLVIQNASDISRESDRVRVLKNRVFIQERRHQDHVHRLGFMTMPFPQDRAPSQGFSVRSQSLHSVQDEPANQSQWDKYELTNQNHWDQYEPANQSQWDQDDLTNQSLKRQPPPKPRRDPGTKLSCSSETEASAEGPGSEKQPPPKPRRNPSTQLSSCFHQSQRSNHGDRRPLDQSDAANEEEPVYIEMGPNQNPDSNQDRDPDGDPEQDEGVYEEMTFTLDSSGPRTVPTPFPNLLSHRPPLLVFPQNQTQALDRTSPQTSDESPLTPLETALGDFFRQDLRPKTQKNPGSRPEPRVRRTSDPVHNQDRVKPDRRSEWSQSVDQIHPERGKDRCRDVRVRTDFRERRLDSEPDLRPDFHQRQYHSLRRDRRPDWRETLDPVKPESTKARDQRDFRDQRKDRDQRRERSLESLERALDQDMDQDLDSFTVTSSGRASAPPLTSRSGPSPVPHSYRRSQSACPSPVKRPPPYDVIMMSPVTPHGGHMTHRVRGHSSAPSGPDQGSGSVQSGSTVPLRLAPNQDQPVHSQASWFFGGLAGYGAPVSGDGPRLSPGDVLMLDTMERKRVLCREIRNRLLRKQPPPPYGATAPSAVGRPHWDTEI